MNEDLYNTMIEANQVLEDYAQRMLDAMLRTWEFARPVVCWAEVQRWYHQRGGSA